jgi:protein SCO1
VTGCFKTTFFLSSIGGCLLCLAACSERAAELPDYGVVPAFEMTNAAGERFSGSALTGKVWVADFIYTSCPAECPMMTAKMHGVEKHVRGEEDVRLVSISVDPQHDTPAALTRFASRYGGPTPQWIFLTGSPETVHTIAFTTFHVGDVIGKIEHSTKFALVDKRGHIRGYYSSLGKDDLESLLRDVEALRRQRS